MASITNTSNIVSKYTLPDMTEVISTSDSNSTETQVIEVDFTARRTGSMDIVMGGSVVNQTITLNNNSEYDITDITVLDTITEGATFNPKSLQIDMVSYVDFDPTKGFTLKSGIRAGSSATITYKLTVSDSASADIKTTSNVTFSANGAVGITTTSNTLTLAIANQSIKMEMENSKSAVIKGDTLMYQVVIINDGNLRNSQLTFRDDLPDKVQFVEGTVKVDDVAKTDANPVTGISLGGLDPNQQIKLSFDVLIL